MYRLAADDVLAPDASPQLSRSPTTTIATNITIPTTTRTMREITATVAPLSGATRATDYQWRPPSPPHINIPPILDDQVQTLPAYIGDVAEENHEILKHITQGNYSVETSTWKYTWRRTAQPVLAFLYLGPASIARDLEFLKREGITMLLVVRDAVSASQGLYSGKKAEVELEIKSEFVNISDHQDLIRKFPDAVQKINQHLVEEFRKQGGLQKIQNHELGKPNTWGKVLVFCESGNERSPAVVAAYLMTLYQIPMVTAIQYIQQHRFCVAFDDALKNLLLSYEQLLEAKRSVMSVPMPNPGSISANGSSAVRGVSAHAKRGRDEVEEDSMDMDMGDADDEARFRGRSTFAPFVSGS